MTQNTAYLGETAHKYPVVEPVEPWTSKWSPHNMYSTDQAVQ